MREPTMADIAARLGVSRQLVSIALRGLPGASSTTRERVQTVAEELGYRPHLAARSLRQTKSRHIGVAFAPVSAPEADLLEAIYPVAAEHGYQLVLSARTGTRSTRQAVDELVTFPVKFFCSTLGMSLCLLGVGVRLCDAEAQGRAVEGQRR